MNQEHNICYNQNVFKRFICLTICLYRNISESKCHFVIDFEHILNKLLFFIVRRSQGVQ